jgi:hypothetical protein
LIAQILSNQIPQLGAHAQEAEDKCADGRNSENLNYLWNIDGISNFLQQKCLEEFA